MRVVRARQVFDGERFIGAADIVIDGPTVMAVGPPSDHGRTPLEDFGDVTVLPGLIDAHQHLTWDCSVDPLAWHREHDDVALLACARVNARRALEAGITTVRDLGSRGRIMLDLREECARDMTAGPNLIVSGPPLTTPGGHCHFLGAECATVEDLLTEVARQAATGVDVIKIMATGGQVTPGSSPGDTQFGAEELKAVVAAARAVGLPVAAHAHGTGGVAAAVEAQVDSIEHCSFMTDEGVDQDSALVALVAASGITVSITAGIAPGPADPITAARLPALIAHVRGLRDAGARCIMSSDAGISPTKPHNCLVYAVAQAVQFLGMPVERALATCTSLAADALAIEQQAGRVRPGLPADLLVVEGLVDTDPDAVRRPLLVLRAGVDVTRHH